VRYERSDSQAEFQSSWTRAPGRGGEGRGVSNFAPPRISKPRQVWSQPPLQTQVNSQVLNFRTYRASEFGEAHENSGEGGGLSLGLTEFWPRLAVSEYESCRLSKYGSNRVTAAWSSEANSLGWGLTRKGAAAGCGGLAAGTLGRGGRRGTRESA